MVQPKYQRIAENLREAINRGTLAPGDKVPSVAELRKQYGVSHITVMSAYQILADSRRIENLSGRGYFVRKPVELRQDTLKNMIGFGFRPLWKYNPRDQYFNEVTCGIQQTCIQRRFSWVQHYSTQVLDTNYFDLRNADEVRRSFLKTAEMVDGYLVDERIPDELVVELYAQIRKPMVIVNRRTELSEVDCVYPSVHDALQNALDFSRKLEYSNFILCLSDWHVAGSLTEMLRESFSDYLVRKKIPENRIVSIPGCNILPHEETFAKLFQTWKSMPEGKTLIVSDIADHLYSALAESGFRPGDNCGLLSAYDLPTAREHNPPITSLQMKPLEVGELSVNVLLERVNGSVLPCRAHTPQAEISLGKTL